MNRSHWKGLLGIVGLMVCLNATAQSDILSSAPSAPASSAKRPVGYQRCDIIPGGFRHGSWETLHLRCHYRHHRVYVTGHFRCTRLHHHHCRHWQWIPEHWVRF